MNILHIDNSRMIHAASKELVESLNHLYFGAQNVSEAYEILSEHKINIIITGLEMSDCDGEEFIRNLNNSPYKNIPVAVLTSTDSFELRQKLFELGVVDYQLKQNFTLKRLKSYVEALAISDELIMTLRRFKVAVIDDSVLTINVIKNIFNLNQVFNVDYFFDVKTLVESEMNYDLYIVDLVLPETSGEELVLKLKEENQESIIIMISSTSNYKTISHVLNLGANDFIVKPFDANTFIIRIKSHIRNHLLMKALEEKNRELLELSVTDGLTKVYNHRHIVQVLKDEVNRSERYNHSLSIILLDLDNFKSVNDTYGHQVGDQVLIEVGKTIKNNIREGDVIGRYGGEEFLVILPETTLEGAIAVGEKLRKAIASIVYEEKKLNTTVSGGIAIFNHFDFSRMIRIADINLYQAKKDGKNRIVC
ncbi:MAG: diguanylate cyclase [Clostridia bacterium]|nr:diguanylate cyclase [Clostridia bacterium]